MTQHEVRIGAILIAVATRRVTVDQLRQYLQIGNRMVADVGAENMPAKMLGRMAAIKSALKRIEREKAKYLN